MNRPVRHRHRTLRGLVAVVAVVSLVLASCGSRPAGDRIRDKRVNNPVRPDSVSTAHGPLRLQHIRIQMPVGEHAAGGDSAMFLTIDNRGAVADRLVAVSSVDARQIIARHGADEPEESIAIDIAPGDVTSLQYIGGMHLELRGLKRTLNRRQFVPVTFRFEQAGPLNIKVFVEGVDHPVVSPLPGT